MLTRILPLLLCLAPATSLAAEVYKEVDKDGVPSFSDQGTPGAERVKITEPTTFSNKDFVPPTPERSTGEPQAKGIKYQLQITSPSDDAAVRENSGALTLNIAISPVLAEGHTAELVMDGQKIKNINGSGPVSLSNLDRGTHEFSIRVIDGRGKVAAESDIISVTMLRHSILKRTPGAS